ncbi:MAG: PAS domain S-box protein, partial [Dehalococcoidia bacterium]|nr:PAS domain S-box protein [Dehalococcoidia bacterium]
MSMEKTPSALRIMLVEDNEHDRLAFRRAFQKSDVPCEITDYARAEDALERLRSDAASFHIVVIDYILPGMSGLDLYREMLNENIRLPAVILTGRGSEHFAVEALKAGIDDYIIKDPTHQYLNLLPIVLPQVVRKYNDRLKREEAEKSLRDSEEKYKTTFEHTGTAMAVIEEDTTISLVNHQFELQSGYSRKEIEGKKSWTELVHPEDLERMKEAHRRKREPGEETFSQYEFRFVDREGNIKHILLTIDIIPGTKQSIATFLDITERKRVEEEIRREKERAEAYLNIAGVMLGTIDADENISLINKKGCEILGYKAEELIGRNWFDTLVPQRIRDEIRSIFGKLMAGDIEPVKHYENTLLTRDGEEKIIAFHNTVIRNPGGEISGILFSGEDITQRKRAEEKLRESVERYRFLLANSLDGIWLSVFEEPIDITLPEAEVVRLIGEREVIVEANDVLAKMYGFDKGSQLTGKRWSELDYAEGLLHLNMEIVRSHYKLDRCVYRGKDSEGNIRYFEESGVGNIVDGKLVSSFGIARDITERKRMEKEKKELEQKAQLASRLASVGEMASGIAHEINNPLTGVIGFSQLLAQREDMPEDIKEQLGIIAEGSQRVASIVSRLLAFARQ